MVFNMSNSSAVMSVYSSILNNEYNWLLLCYTNDAYDELALHSYGVEGLEELKTKLSNLQQVFIAFYRDEFDAGYIIINYIPSSVSGAKRARVLVHSRRVGTMFKKHQAFYTVDSISSITSHNVHQAITGSEATFSSFAGHIHSPSQSTDKPLPKPEYNSNINPVPDYLQSPAYPEIQERSSDPAGKSSTGQYSSDYVPHLPVVYTAPRVTDRLKFFKLLRHKKKKNDFPRGSLPPQTPPKDNERFRTHSLGVTRSDIRPPRTDKILQHRRSHTVSNCTVISHARDSEDKVVMQFGNRPLQDSAQLNPLSLPAKWAQKGTFPTDPAERARRRRELELQREREEQELVKEEAERQRRLKLEKERVLQQEKEEEARRLAEVEREISRIRLERRRREQSEKEEEERRLREIEDRKLRDRKRRLEEHQRAEEWRRQQAQKLEAAAHEAAEIQRREEAKRRERAEAVVKQTKGEEKLTGWITMQSRDAVSWRRRYFKFAGTSILLYRSAEDMNTPLEELDLRGNVSGLKEWYEGYEDLEAIGFSFVVEFKNGRAPLSIYADCEEEKYKLLGLLRVAAGL